MVLKVTVSVQFVMTFDDPIFHNKFTLFSGKPRHNIDCIDIIYK
jgi:hypothetical protein